MFIFRLRSIYYKLCKFSSHYCQLRPSFRKFGKLSQRSSIVQRQCYCTNRETTKTQTDIANGRASFEEVLAYRRQQAKRSYLVQVFSEQSSSELFEYCDNLAPIKSMFHYVLNKSNHFVLIELQEDDVLRVFSHAKFMDESESLPVFSNMLWFKAAKTKRKCMKKLSDLPLIFSSKEPLENELLDLLKAAVSISDQVLLLYNSTKLDELGTRLRFFTACQVEHAISGLFPIGRVLPFGSSINGFGRMGCDLDLVLQLKPPSPYTEEERLIYQGKAFGAGTRASSQRQMELLADILHVYLPGASAVRRILQARVPIIKYTCNFTGIECDLSLSSMSGVYMSEVLHTLGCVDARLRPLVFSVKRWAAATMLTSPTPGRWITNFSLTTLIIFYLQSLKLLPSIDLLVKLARPEDERFDTDVTSTFLREPDLVPRPTENTKVNDMNLESLLTGFFYFYSTFDYDSSAINIYTGVKLPKPDHSPLYIVNPLERGLNVSRNVSSDEVERLRMTCRTALWTLEEVQSLLPLITPSKTQMRPTEPSVVLNKRIVSVKDLFAEGSNR